ncbi:hypothetical protein JCM10212_001462 [Sporobolomyces blumeae]
MPFPLTSLTWDRARISEFNPVLLRPFLKRIVSQPEIARSTWTRDAAMLMTKAQDWADDVKQRMIDLGPTGYKYLVNVSYGSPLRKLVSERGSSSSTTGAGRGVLSTFWDPSTDVAVSEVFQNDTVVVTILAVAIRVVYS